MFTFILLLTKYNK